MHDKPQCCLPGEVSLTRLDPNYFGQFYAFIISLICAKLPVLDFITLILFCIIYYFLLLIILLFTLWSSSLCNCLISLRPKHSSLYFVLTSSLCLSYITTSNRSFQPHSLILINSRAAGLEFGQFIGTSWPFIKNATNLDATSPNRFHPSIHPSNGPTAHIGPWPPLLRFHNRSFLWCRVVSPTPNPQPGGPGLRIYDPRRQSGPAIPPGTG
jgi:hypothetical protein